MFCSYVYAFVIYLEIVNRLWLQNANLCNYVYKTCTTVTAFHTGYTYVATYICEALCDNIQIQLQLAEYIAYFKTHVHAVCSLWKEGFPLATDTAT